MGEIEVNVPLLRKAVEWAEAEAAKPAIDCRWNQGTWLTDPENVAYEIIAGTPLDDMWSIRGFTALEQNCGTAYCIAGYVGTLLDARYAVETIVDYVHVADAAALALGIDTLGLSEEGGLFAADNTIEDVRRIAEEIAGERL